MSFTLFSKGHFDQVIMSPLEINGISKIRCFNLNNIKLKENEFNFKKT